VVRATGVDGNPIAVAFFAACHPVCTVAPARLISSDFVGIARQVVEAGSGGLALFFQGYAGTCDPASQPNTAGSANKTGAQFDVDVLAILNGQMDALDARQSLA
jgi:hypothetical protein